MRTKYFASAALLAVLAVAPRAAADPMDVTLSRLGVDGMGQCPADGSVPTCVGDEANYQRLMLQLGNVVAHPVLSPARTLGYRHFYVGLESSVTSIHGPSTQAARNYWSLGTDGGSSATYEQGNLYSESRLPAFRIATRKGLPFGFELGASVGRLVHTSNWLWGFELKWSLLEGFRRGGAAFLPDLAVRGTVTGITGTRGFTMTVPTADVILSKGFVLGRTLWLTPFVAGQMVWTIVDSGVVDLSPGSVTDNDTGANLYVFDKIRAWHPRIAAGFQIQYLHFQLTGAFRYDLGDPSRGLDAVNGSPNPKMPQQWAVDVGVGVAY